MLPSCPVLSYILSICLCGLLDAYPHVAERTEKEWLFCPCHTVCPLAPVLQIGILMREKKQLPTCVLVHCLRCSSIRRCSAAATLFHTSIVFLRVFLPPTPSSRQPCFRAFLQVMHELKFICQLYTTSAHACVHVSNVKKYTFPFLAHYFPPISRTRISIVSGGDESAAKQAYGRTGPIIYDPSYLSLCKFKNDVVHAVPIRTGLQAVYGRVDNG